MTKRPDLGTENRRMFDYIEEHPGRTDADVRKAIGYCRPGTLVTAGYVRRVGALLYVVEDRCPFGHRRVDCTCALRPSFWTEP